jgi:thioredoxin 1
MNAHDFVDITTASFDTELTRELPLLLELGAPRCAPCRMIEPELAAIAETYAGRVRVGQCNADANPELAERLGVLSLPTLLMFKNGRVIGQLVGAVPRRRISALVETAL